MIAAKIGQPVQGDSAANRLQRGERSVAPSGGPFPPGCKWRAVSPVGEKRAEWAVREYEYWQEGAGLWGPRQPPNCLARSSPATLQ